MAVLRLWIHFQLGLSSEFSSVHTTRKENSLNCIGQVFIAFTDYKAQMLNPKPFLSRIVFQTYISPALIGCFQPFNIDQTFCLKHHCDLATFISLTPRLASNYHPVLVSKRGTINNLPGMCYNGRVGGDAGGWVGGWGGCLVKVGGVDTEMYRTGHSHA